MNLHYIWKLVPTSQTTQCVPIINTKLLIYCDGKVFLGAFPKLRKATISFIVSVCPCICPHRITRLPMDGFSSNLIFVYFSKCCYKNSSFIKISQELRMLYTKSNLLFSMSLSLSLSHFFLEWEIFQANVVENIETQILWFFFFCKIPALYEIMWTNVVESERPQIFEKVVEYEIYVVIFPTTFVCNISHSKKNWESYCLTCT